MSKLIRMDQTGHSTIAEWSLDDPASTRAARAAFDQQLEEGCLAVVTQGEGHARQVRELPIEEPLVILRRAIAGG